MRKILAVIGACIAIAVFGAPVAANASVGTPHLRESPTGPWLICTAFGNEYCMISAFEQGNNIVLQGVSGNYMTVDTIGTYGPYTTAHITFSNGTYLAATDDCTILVVKDSSTDNGVVWALRGTGNGINTYLINRYCDEPPYGNNEYDEVASGDNTQGDAWFIDPIGAGGTYAKLLIHSPEP